MYPYLRTYQLGVSLAQRQLGAFDIPPRSRFSYAVKSGNLAACFLGFSTDEGEPFYRKSAELGCLAALFDLLTDGLRYDSDASRAFGGIVKATLDPELAELTFNLIDRKQQKKFGMHGLERGVDALRIVIKHLQAEKNWRSQLELYDTGILFQTIDDVLDFEDDSERRELNFIGQPGFEAHLRQLIRWNYKHELRHSRRPMILFHAIGRARVKARDLLLAPESTFACSTPSLQRRPFFDA